jgi:hypothetical protein
MTTAITHEGNDPMGALTLHRGLLENCPAPDCQDRVLEQQDAWGVYCPHGKQIVEKDPDRTDPEGYPVGRLVDPWPCDKDGCTLEAFEQEEQEREDEYWDAMNEIASDVYR